MNDPFAHIQDEVTGDPFAHITEDNTPSVPMSQAKTLPPTWSPVVKGQKLNAVYDPDARAYITTDYGLSQKIVRQKDGSLDLVEHKPSTASMVKDFAVNKVLPVVNDVARDINRGVAGLPASLLSGVGELYNLGAGAVGAEKIPSEYMPSNVLHRVTDTGREPSISDTALEFGVSALSGTGLAKSAANVIEQGARAAATKLSGESGAIVAPTVSTAEGSLRDFASSPALQTASGAAAGGAGQLAKEKGASPTEQIFSSLAAGILAPVAAFNAIKLANRSTLGMSENAMQNRLGQKLINLVNDGKITPKEAADALRRGVDIGIEGSKPTSGQVLYINTGNKGLLLGEDAAISPNAREIVRSQLEDNRTARQGALGLNGVEKGAQQSVQIARQDINATKDSLLASESSARQNALISEQNAKQSIADSEQALKTQQENAINQAKADQDKAFNELGNKTDKHETGAEFVKTYDDLKNTSKDSYKLAFESVDPFQEIKSIRINTPRIAAIKDKYYGGVSLAEGSDFKKAIKAIEQEVAKNKAANDIPELSIVRPDVPKLPKLSRGAVNPQTDDLLAAISKYGGLSREAAIKLGIDPAEFNKRAHSGMVIFPKTGGLSSDEMAVRLSQDGYPVGRLGDEDVRLFEDNLHNAMSGEKVLTPSGYELQAARDFAVREQELFDDNFRPIPQVSGNATLSYKQQRTLDSMIGAFQRDAKNATDAAALTELKSLVRNMLSDAARRGEIPKDIAENNSKAISMFAEHNRRFNEGASKIMHKKGYERLAKIEANIPSALLKSAESVQSFYKSIGVSNEIIESAKNFIASEFRRAVSSSDTGQLKSGWREKASQFIINNKPMLDTVPDLRDKLTIAVNKAKTVEDLDSEFSKVFAEKVAANKKIITDMTGENKQVISELVNQNKIAEKQLLERGGSYFDNLKDPVQVVRDLMSNNSKLHKMEYVKYLSQKDEDFKNGLRSAVADELKVMDDKALISWLGDSSNKAFVKNIFGDDYAKLWQAIAEDAKRDTLSSSRKDTTALQLSTKREGIKSKSALGIKGKEPEHFIGGLGAILASLAGGGIPTAIGAYLASRGLLNAARNAVGKYEQMEGKAFANPKEAARLIEKVSEKSPYALGTKKVITKTLPATALPSSQRKDK